MYELRDLNGAYPEGKRCRVFDLRGLHGCWRVWPRTPGLVKSESSVRKTRLIPEHAQERFTVPVYSSQVMWTPCHCQGSSPGHCGALWHHAPHIAAFMVARGSSLFDAEEVKS